MEVPTTNICLKPDFQCKDKTISPQTNRFGKFSFHQTRWRIESVGSWNLTCKYLAKRHSFIVIDDFASRFLALFWHHLENFFQYSHTWADLWAANVQIFMKFVNFVFTTVIQFSLREFWKFEWKFWNLDYRRVKVSVGSCKGKLSKEGFLIILSLECFLGQLPTKRE